VGTYDEPEENRGKWPFRQAVGGQKKYEDLFDSQRVPTVKHLCFYYFEFPCGPMFKLKI
jgi:hypothetical protein